MVEDSEHWTRFTDEEPAYGNIVQQYLGDAVLDHNNPPDWAFPTSRYSKDNRRISATHWRYVEGPDEVISSEQNQSIQHIEESGLSFALKATLPDTVLRLYFDKQDDGSISIALIGKYLGKCVQIDFDSINFDEAKDFIAYLSSRLGD